MYKKIESYSHRDVEATSLLEQAAAPGWPRGLNEVEEQNGRSQALIVIRCSGVVGWQRVVGTPPQIRRATACGGVHIKIGPPPLTLYQPFADLVYYWHVQSRYQKIWSLLPKTLTSVVFISSYLCTVASLNTAISEYHTLKAFCC